MHRFFVPQLYSEEMYIEGVDARHISKVLRMQPGDKLQIVSDDGVSAMVAITAIDSERVWVRCLEKLAERHEPRVQLVLAQGLAKGEKMDFIIQKAVELGAHQIMPVMMKRTNVKLDDKKADRKAERLQEISKSAATQAKRGIIPEVTGVTAFRKALANVADADIKLICYEDETSRGTLEALLPTLPQAKKIALLVGPEGGISEEEWQLAKDAGFQSVSLGKRILRTETAGFCLLSYLMLHLENA